MIQGIIVNSLAGALLTLNTAAPLINLSTPLVKPNILVDTKPRIETSVYVVHEGDSLATIAQKYYGSSDQWTTLWNDNDSIQDPNIINPGQKLIIRSTAPKQAEELRPSLAARESAIEQAAVEAQQEYAPQVTYTNFAVPVYHYTAPVQTPVAIPSQPQTASNYDAVYQSAAAKYGVPWGILKGLHAVESGYHNGSIYNHSGSGASGPFQFMPGTWAAYHDPNHPDINSAVDGAYAAARYLSEHGNNINALYQYGTNVRGVLSVSQSTGSTY